MKTIILAALLGLSQVVAFGQVPVVASSDPEALFTDDDPVLHTNKQVVLRMMRELLQCNHWHESARWMNEAYIQHNPNIATGRAPIAEFFSRLRRPSPICDRLTTAIVAVVAEDDLVTVAWRMVCDEPSGAGTYTSTWFNMWRVVGGKLDEHWDPAIKTPLTCRIGE